MAEEGGTIIERIVRFVMGIEGGEKVTEDIKRADRASEEYIATLKELKSTMDSLAQATREGVHVWTSEYIPQIKGITQATDQWSTKIPGVAENLKRLSVEQFTASQTGQELLRSYGYLPPVIEETETAAAGLRRGFWDLNTAARALLRIFVAFKVIIGMLSFLRDMAEASANLQAEFWRLRAVVMGVSDQIEGDAGTWEEWLDRVERLRAILPLVSTAELVEGLRRLTGVLGPLGLTADEIERVTGLVGQMAIVMGEDFPSYTNRFISALGGALRNIGTFGIDLRDSNQAMMDYAETLGFVWDELNAGQRQWIRLGFFVQEATGRTHELVTVMDEEWAQLEELRKKREDILAQSPELIEAQLEWARVLLGIATLLERLIGLIPQYTGHIRRLVEVLGIMIPPVKGLIDTWDEWQEHLQEQRVSEWIDSLREPWQEMEEVVEDFDETVKENVQAMEDQGDAAEELGDKLSQALQQANNALLSYQRAAGQAWERLNRRLADIAENLERRLADLERTYEARRDQLIRRFEERRADIREDAAEREEELREDLNKRLRRMEEDHQRDMQELREDYLIDLEEAARSRDAISMRRIQQRYILEKRRREQDYETDRRRAQEDYEEQLEDLREAREEQERELEESLERQLRELEENYQRQQEEARLNAQQQQEDAQEDYRQRLQDLEQNFQERLASIINNLLYEEQEFEDAYGALREFLDTWYRGDINALAAWLNERLRLLQEAGLIEPREPIPYPEPGLHGTYIPMAAGGMGIATQPTRIMVGERGPEAFAAWPAGTRLPSQAIDIRLTIDGEQSGLWSIDFENQVVRVLHGVLREVGL